jgi:hypothetical protein
MGNLKKMKNQQRRFVVLLYLELLKFAVMFPFSKYNFDAYTLWLKHLLLVRSLYPMGKLLLWRALWPGENVLKLN